MKKFAKMSLVAAVAVAGFTSAASAKPLEEAIKNVDVSGSVVYRYNDYQDDYNGATTNKTSNNYKIGLTAKAKVNDDVTAVTRFIIGNPTTNDLGLASLDTGTSGDASVDVELSNVYFSYTGLANTTINVGKQGLTTPWTVAVDSDSNEQTGTGILALTNVGPVTLAAAYFNQTNLNVSGDDTTTLGNLGTAAGVNVGATDIWTVAIMGNIGPVALDAWYLDMDELFDTFTLGAKAKFDLDALKLGIEARYTSLDTDDFNADNELWKLALSAQYGIFDASIKYAGTDKEGGLVALDNDAETVFNTWNVTPNGEKDADFWNVVLGVQALPSLHVSANYSHMEYEENAEQEELYAQFKYKMSKNFGGYIRYGQYTKDDNTGVEVVDGTRGRLQVEYTF
ncbi:major outer membrane protein [Halarcobacter ebronensis]|uniref:Porin domain-containing protein n=1 Tax=Halarcobacter ebronensis TaxID=1462615 RepID=A0A4Q1ALX3_9BACT|nr:major outer membrane protein [Halarcobacter ebronensis]QKF80927.1 Campylo_MOMP domain-containing protein [Halarcobacter ebronensis]RXK06245.1 hypothetical protein CRV07_05980 [Halarcobacter ebronensis]